MRLTKSQICENQSKINQNQSTQKSENPYKIKENWVLYRGSIPLRAAKKIKFLKQFQTLKNPVNKRLLGIFNLQKKGEFYLYQFSKPIKKPIKQMFSVGKLSYFSRFIRLFLCQNSSIRRICLC